MYTGWASMHSEKLSIAIFRSRLYFFLLLSIWFLKILWELSCTGCTPPVVFQSECCQPLRFLFLNFNLQATYNCILSSGKVFLELTSNWRVLSWLTAVGPWSANLVYVTLWILLLSFVIVFHSTLGTQRFASYSTWNVDCVHVTSALLNCLTFKNL